MTLYTSSSYLNYNFFCEVLSLLLAIVDLQVDIFWLTEWLTFILTVGHDVCNVISLIMNKPTSQSFPATPNYPVFGRAEALKGAECKNTPTSGGSHDGNEQRGHQRSPSVKTHS